MADVARSSVRHRIARLTERHFIEGTLTAVATTSATDTNELVNYADDYLIGSFIYLYSAGANGDQERRITDNTQSTGQLTVPSWTLPTGTVKYEIHKGVRVKDYNEAINHAIRTLSNHGPSFKEKVADTSLTMTADGTSTSYYYNVPSGFQWIWKILYEDATSDIYDQEVPIGAWKGSLELKTAATTTTDPVYQLRLDRRYWEPISGRKLRILGDGAQDEVSADTSGIAEEIESYVVHHAAYWLVSQNRHGLGPDAKAAREIAGEMYRLSQEARMGMRHFPRSGTTILRR